MLRAGKIGLRARDEDDVAVLHAELYEDIAARMQADSRPWRPIPAGSAASPYAVSGQRDDSAVFSVVELAGGELAGEALLWAIDLHKVRWRRDAAALDRRLGAAKSCVRPCRGCLQIVQLWTSSASSDGWPRRRSIRAAVNSRSFRCGAGGWSGDLDSVRRGGSPGMLTWGESAGLRRRLDGAMVALFWARPVAAPGAGRWSAGRPVRCGRRGRGWAAAAWLGRVRRRIQL